MEIGVRPPELAGLLCEALICEGFVHRGELVSNTNVVSLRLGGTWHKLIIDHGYIIWRLSVETPQPWSVEEHGWQYPHTDFGAMAGVIGCRLEYCRSEVSWPEVKVTFAFENGRAIVVDSPNDISMFQIS